MVVKKTKRKIALYQIQRGRGAGSWKATILFPNTYAKIGTSEVWQTKYDAEDWLKQIKKQYGKSKTSVWQMQNVGKLGNTTNIIWWNKKGSRHDDKLELFKAPSIDGKDWGVSQRQLGQRNFKTKTQALAYARAYMRKH